MSITSFYYLVLITLGVLIYYVIPQKAQWVILLCLSLVFYYFAATPYTIGYLIAVNFDCIYLDHLGSKKERKKWKRSERFADHYNCCTRD